MLKYSDLKNERKILSEVIPLNKPFTILFEPTSVCNFSCLHCFQSEASFHEHLPKGFLKLEEFKKIINDFKSWNGDKLKVVRFIGFGEPMLNFDLDEMIKYLKKSDIAERVEVTSNCSVLTENLSEVLVDSQVDYLRVSIYSANQEKHEKITNSKISIKKILENLKVLTDIKKSKNSEKPFIYIKMLKSDDDAENDEFFKMYKDISDEISLEKPHSWLNSNEKDEKIICPQPFKMMSIHYNGDVISCDPDWKGNTFIGNAIEESIEKIWNGKKLRDFWKLQLEGRRKENLSCKNCSFLNSKDYVVDDIDCLYEHYINNKLIIK